MRSKNPEAKTNLYSAPKDHAVLVDVPDEAFISLDGEGSPSNPAFGDAIRSLYSLAYTLHFQLKKERREAHPVPPLEGLWWWEGGDRFPVENKAAWRWRLMIQQPASVTKDELFRAKAAAKAKHPELPFDRIRWRHFREGPAMQMIHVGPYKEELRTVTKLADEISKAGYKPRGMHHEIYLGDPRRAKPANLRTLIRQPVRKT